MKSLNIRSHQIKQHALILGKGFKVMKQNIVILLLLAVLFLSPATDHSAWAAPTIQNSDQKEIHTVAPTIELDSEGVTLTWNAAEINFEALPDGTTRISAAGFETLYRPGYPQIPVASVLLAVPANAEPDIEVISLKEETKTLANSILVSPRPDGILRDSSGEYLELNSTPKNPTTIPFNSPIELEMIGIVRGVSLARISFYPVIPQGNELTLTKQIKARIDYNNYALSPQSIGDSSNDPILTALKNSVVNPTQVSPSEINQAPLINMPNAVSDVLIVEVEQVGISELTYQDLLDADFPVAQVNPHNLQLIHKGTQVALEWEGDGDNSFESGERLLFFAYPESNRWATFDTYLLSEGSSAGQRMTGRSANPAGTQAGTPNIKLVFEENLYYSPNCFCGSTPLARDGDRWVWNELDISKPETTFRRYYSDLPNIDPSIAGVLTVWLIGYTDTIHPIDHNVEVFLNGTLLGNVEWDGKKVIEAQFDLPGDSLKADDNELALNLPGISGVSKEGMWLDAYQIQYGLQNADLGEAVNFSGEQIPRAYNLNLTSNTGLRAYQVTNPDQPLRLTDVQINSNTISFKDPSSMGPQDYAASTESGIQTPSGLRLQSSLPTIGVNGFSGAEYIAISHSDFISSITPLINYRQNQGLNTLTQDIQPIFDNYSDGIPSPQAVRDYLEDAYLNWPVTPIYILLVGDGTYDPKHFDSNSSNTFIPPYLADVDPWAGETASDNRFVAVDGSDNLPDMLLGRLPVNSADEADIIVQKILAYEYGSMPGDWPQDTVFVADNADTAGDFPANSNELADDVHLPFQTDKIYHTDSTLTSETRSRILQSLNNGSGVTVYSGHSSVHQWAIENFLHYDDIASLENGSRLPILVEATCFTSFFQRPDLSTLDEGFLRHNSGGAVAIWGPSGMGLPEGHLKLVEGFIQSVYQNNQRNLGQAIQAGRLHLATEASAYSTLIDTQTLLGDPATTIMLSSTSATNHMYLPFVER
jgi:hypothetical protein